MIGIALGVAVLITVLSVMNGFDREIKNRVFSMVPPVTVSSVTGYVAGWKDLQKTMKEFPFVTASAPFASGEVLLNYGGSVQPAIVTGILPDEEKSVSALSEKIINSTFYLPSGSVRRCPARRASRFPPPDLRTGARVTRRGCRAPRRSCSTCCSLP